MVYVTHDQVEAMTMADRIVVLRDGRAEQVGTPLELYNHPANRFVAGFIGSPQMNFLTARITAAHGDGVRITLDAAPDAAAEAASSASVKSVADQQRVFVGIRPEHVVLGSASTNALQVNVSIDQVEQLGAMTFLYCSLPNGERLTVHAAGQQAYASGSPLTVSLPLIATHIFDTAAGEPALVRR
jgi:ABC-type sugar transport system ATPase subunit